MLLQGVRQGHAERAGGIWNPNFVYQKWPDKSFPILNFGFSEDGHFGFTVEQEWAKPSQDCP